MRRHDVKRLGLALVSCAAVTWGVMGCSSTKSAKVADPAEQEVMYSPPADADVPANIPGGAPILDEYATPQPTGASPQNYPAARDGYTPTPGEVTRKELDRLLSQGPGFGLAHVKVKPVKGERGELLGYEVSEFTDAASLWLTPALSVGDQITHLNGVKIKTPDDYMEAWSLSSTLEELRIDYVRNGEANYSSWLVVD